MTSVTISVQVTGDNDPGNESSLCVSAVNTNTSVNIVTSLQSAELSMATVQVSESTDSEIGIIYKIDFLQCENLHFA